MIEGGTETPPRRPTRARRWIARGRPGLRVGTEFAATASLPATAGLGFAATEAPVAKKGKANTAKRAAKKHAKEVKRRREIADRGRPAPEPRSPLDAWRPAKEGIEGLARRMELSTHEAGRVAEALHQNHGRKDAAQAWLPSRLTAMNATTIVEALGKLGITIDEPTFQPMAAEYLSARKLAESEWIPALGVESTVHDRDFCGEAAERLWALWCPALASDEVITDQMVLAEGLLDSASTSEAMQGLVDAWKCMDPESAPQRLAAAGHTESFLEFCTELLEERPDSPGQYDPSAPALREALRRIRDHGGLSEAAEFRVISTVDYLNWQIDGADAALDQIVREATDGNKAERLLDGCPLLLGNEWTTEAQFQRLRDALVGQLHTVEGLVREDFEIYITGLETRLAEPPRLLPRRSTSEGVVGRPPAARS